MSKSKIALFLCLGFIFLAFIKDKKESRQLSILLWIPCLWLAVLASRPLSAWFHPNRLSFEANYIETDIGGNPIDRSFFTVLLFVGLLVLYARRDRISFSLLNNKYLFLFYLYALLSIGWSDDGFISLKRWIRMTGDLIMVLLILTDKDQQEAIDHVLRRCAILLIPLSLVLFRYFGNIGRGYDMAGGQMVTGVCTQKNSLGILCAFLGVHLFWRIIQKWPKFSYLDGFLFILGSYILYLSRSATSMIVFILGVMLLFVFNFLKGDIRKMKRLIVISAACILLLQGVFITFFDTSVETQFFEVTKRDSSFTERVPLWSKLLEIGSERPIFGAGFGGAWSTGETAKELSVGGVPNSHNGYIHVFMDLGLVGLMFLFFLIAQAYKKISNSIGQKWEINKLQFVYLVMIVLHNVTESSFARTDFLWLLFLVSSVVVVVKDNSLVVVDDPVLVNPS